MANYRVMESRMERRKQSIQRRLDANGVTVHQHVKDLNDSIESQMVIIEQLGEVELHEDGFSPFMKLTFLNTKLRAFTSQLKRVLRQLDTSYSQEQIQKNELLAMYLRNQIRSLQRQKLKVLNQIKVSVESCFQVELAFPEYH